MREADEDMFGYRFRNRTVIVTGAGSGIGRAAAALVHDEGGRVIAVDISAERLQDLGRDLRYRLDCVVGDLPDPATITDVLAAAGDRVDGLANIAGIMDGFEPTAEIRDETWDRVLAVNVTAMMRLTRAVLPRMVARGSGSIVNVSSEAGQRGSAAGTPYTVSKLHPSRSPMQRSGARSRGHEHRRAVPFKMGAAAPRAADAGCRPTRRPSRAERRGDRVAALRCILERIRGGHRGRRGLGGDLRGLTPGAAAQREDAARRSPGGVFAGFTGCWACWRRSLPRRCPGR